MPVRLIHNDKTYFLAHSFENSRKTETTHSHYIL